MNPPRLTEYSAKDFLFQSLQHCHANRINIYYYILNFGVLFLFVLVVGGVLYSCYKNKLSPYEKNQRMLQEQEYILSKIRFHQEDRKQTHSTGITNLPTL